MLENEIKAAIRRIVARQFVRLTGLSQKAYNASLEMIANEIYDLIRKDKTQPR